MLDPLFNFGGQGMGGFSKEVCLGKNNGISPVRITGIAMPQPMKLTPAWEVISTSSRRICAWVFGATSSINPPIDWRINFLHPKDVQGDKNRNNGIKTQPACEDS